MRTCQPPHGYVQIDLRMKQQALAQVDAPPELAHGKFPSDELIAWLEGIGRTSRYVQHQPLAPPATGVRQAHST